MRVSGGARSAGERERPEQHGPARCGGTFSRARRWSPVVLVVGGVCQLFGFPACRFVGFPTCWEVGELAGWQRAGVMNRNDKAGCARGGRRRAGGLGGVRGGPLPCRRVGSRCLGRSEVCGEVRFPVVLVLVLGLVLVFGGGAGRRGVAGRRRARATETTRAGAVRGG